MVNLIIIDEDSGNERNISFNSEGTFYELAQAIKDSGMEFPEFFNLLTNGAKLEASETKKISFTENQKIKIRDVSSLENFGSIDFVDVTLGKVSLIKVGYEGPKYLRVIKGINIFGVCENEKCEAYKKKVIQKIKENEYDMTKNQGTMNCPICNSLCLASTVGFYDCFYNIYGTKFDEKNDEIEKFGTKIPDLEDATITGDNTIIINGQKIEIKKTEKGNVSYFNEATGKTKFLKLIFQVKKW